MDFKEDVRLDPGQISDVRGRRVGPGVALGGGVSVIGLIIALLLGVNPGDLIGSSSGLQSGPVPESDLRERCRTGADAERYDDCRIVGIVNSVQAFWQRELPGYREAQTQLFTEATTTRCGHATSAVGPFYCPADQGVYLDLGFFEVLRTRLGARGGEFAQAYVVAHEYGHHVQNLTGTTSRTRDSIRIELQADCYAGAWAANAVETGYLENLSRTDIEDGLDAAAAVGDDRIQERTQGRVDPESWTHGSSQQRQDAFMQGYRGGEAESCPV